MTTSKSNDPVELDHVAEFERAWDDPRHTRFELPPVDVNAVLAERYDTDQGFTMTGAMLWDLEVRKAWSPDRYIPFVVEAGSADAWDHDPATDTFVRVSRQRMWLKPDQYDIVIERTHRDHANRRVTFLGVAEHPGPDGAPLRAGVEQPLFHVEHAVGGTEDRPVNLWRIVHLTTEPDPELLEVFGRIGRSEWLPEFVEIYLRDDLGIRLSRTT